MTQDHELRSVLAALEMSPYGTTQQFSPGHSYPESKSPTGIHEREPSPAEFRQRYEREKTDRGRDEVIVEARTLLDSWKPSAVDRPDTEVNIEQLVIDEGEGFAAEHVAARFGISPSYVRAIRHRGKRQADNGNPVDSAILSAPNRRLEVKRLWGEGLTQRQIAMKLRFSVGTINGDLRALELRKGRP